MCLNVCACLFVCTVHVCPWTNTAPPPLMLTGRWMLAVTPAWICSCQMRWGHEESTKTLINLNHCPALCWSLPVASNIYLVAADTGKSAYAHRKQVAKPTGLCCRPARGSDKYRVLLETLPHSVVQLSFTLTDRGYGHHQHHYHYHSADRNCLYWRDATPPEASCVQQHQTQNKLGELEDVKHHLTLPTGFFWMGEIFAFYIQKQDQMYFAPNKALSAFVQASNLNYI